MTGIGLPSERERPFFGEIGHNLSVLPVAGGFEVGLVTLPVALFGLDMDDSRLTFGMGGIFSTMAFELRILLLDEEVAGTSLEVEAECANCFGSSERGLSLCFGTWL